jgi:serine phosphatase RsbU (regulator of sigma subunit)
MDLFDEFEYQDTLLARRYADSVLYFAKENNGNWLMGRAHQYMGWYLQDRARFGEANSQFYKSLSYLRKAKDAQGIADAYGNLGNSYLDIDEYQKSLNSQLLSLTANENILKGNPVGDDLLHARRGLTYALSNIGAVYAEIGMYEKALEYEYRSLNYEIEAESGKGQAISYNAIATLHKEFGVTDSSEFYFLKAMEIYKEIPNNYGFSSTLMEYSTLEGANLSEERRIEMLKEAHQIRIDMGDAHGEAEVLVEICTIYFDDLSTDSLSVMLKRCYEIIDTEGLESFREDYFKIYSKYNSRLGKFQSAFFALENYLELKGVSDEKQRTHDLIVGDVKYQLENKYYNDSLQSQNEFAVKETKHAKDIAYIQNVVYLGVIGFIVLIVSLFYFIGSNRRKNRLNGILSEKNTVIQEQKSVVDEKNQSISDSINYARRLQAAILPTSEQINQFIPNSFLFFRPKDVVSGDFHWFENKGDLIFLAVADCTGHGVPGAMVSVVCSNALNRTVNEFGLIRPKDILDKTRDLVIDTFAKSGDQVSDGMDISLISIDKKTKKVVFAGAHNSLWIIRDSEKIDASQFAEKRLMKGEKRSLIEYKGDKQPVGLYAELNKFSEVEIDLEENDILYLFSDGLIDQFGGEKGKKFKSIPFKKGLLENCELSMELQKTKLVKTFDDWQGDQDQIDDVCVMGLRVPS